MSVTKVTTDLPNKEQGDVCQIISPGIGVTITSLPYPPSINMTFSIWWRAIGSEASVEIDAVGAHENAIVPIEWTRYSVVADPPDGRDVDIIPSDSTPIQIYMAQLEQGGAASDWHPAPEDDEEAIEANKQSIMKITPEYIITTVTESEPYNELTGTVTKHETSITQNAREISLRATKQEFDEFTADAITTKNAELKISPDLIQSKVTQTTFYTDEFGETKALAKSAIQTITATMIQNVINDTSFATSVVKKNDSEYTTTVSKAASAIQTVTATMIQNVIGNTTFYTKDYKNTKDKADGAVQQTYIESNYSTTSATSDMISNKVSSIKSGGSNLLVRAGMIKTYLKVADGTYDNPNADLTDDNYTGPVTTNYFIPVSAETKDFTINLYDTRTAETGLYMIFCEYGENNNFIKSQEWIGLINPGHKTFTVGDTTKYIKATVDGYPHYRWKLEHGNLASDWSGANEELVVSSEMKITANQVLFRTPEFVVDIYDDSSAKKALKIDKDGAQFTKVYAPNVAKVYDGSATVNISNEVELYSLMSTISNSVLTGDLTIYLQTNLTCSFKLSGVSGTGIIKFHGTGSDLIINTIYLENCSIPIYFYNIYFRCNSPTLHEYEAHNTGINISACKYAYFQKCIFQSNGDRNFCRMFYVWHDSTLAFDACEFYEMFEALEMHCSKLLMMGENKGSNNDSSASAPVAGIVFTMYSSIAMLRGKIPRSYFDMYACLCAPADPESLPVDAGDNPTQEPAPSYYDYYLELGLSGSYKLENGVFKGNVGNALSQGVSSIGNNVYRYCGWMYFNFPSGITSSNLQSATLYLTRADNEIGAVLEEVSVGIGLMSGTGLELNQQEIQYNSRSTPSVAGTSYYTDVNKSYNVTDKIRALLDSNSVYYRGRLTLDYDSPVVSWLSYFDSNPPVLMLRTTTKITT